MGRRRYRRAEYTGLGGIWADGGVEKICGGEGSRLFIADLKDRGGCFSLCRSCSYCAAWAEYVPLDVDLFMVVNMTVCRVPRGL